MPHQILELLGPLLCDIRWLFHPCLHIPESIEIFIHQVMIHTLGKAFNVGTYTEKLEVSVGEPTPNLTRSDCCTVESITTWAKNIMNARCSVPGMPELKNQVIFGILHRGLLQYLRTYGIKRDDTIPRKRARLSSPDLGYMEDARIRNANNTDDAFYSWLNSAPHLELIEAQKQITGRLERGITELQEFAQQCAPCNSSGEEIFIAARSPNLTTKLFLKLHLTLLQSLWPRILGPYISLRMGKRRELSALRQSMWIVRIAKMQVLVASPICALNGERKAGRDVNTFGLHLVTPSWLTKISTRSIISSSPTIIRHSFQIDTSPME